uniref:CLASP N-terminal domain-containing protein n=1 Tax=Globisporangium ultimum (strain ATCC 200006 / CBS 805.95 / DAOM BR144) TaxID=431595 RepID=K3X4G7_GLOUD
MLTTYVTIQIISTSADTCIRGVIESTKNGYARFISKLMEGAKSRNQVLRLHCVKYLTLTLQRWSSSHLSKHSDMFLAILPIEADNLFNRLDASTQKNLRDDAARTSENERMKANESDRSTVSRKLKLSSKPPTHDAVQTSTSTAPALTSVQRVLQHSTSMDGSSGSRASSTSSVSGPRRVLGTSSGSFSTSDSYGDGSESGRFPSRVLSQGALRVGFDSRQKASSLNEEPGNDWKKQHTPVRPLRVLSSSETTLPPKTPGDNLFSARSGGFQTSPLSGKPKRVQIATADVNMSSQSSVLDQQESGPSEKAKPVTSQASPSLASHMEKSSEPSVPASLQVKPSSLPQPAKQFVKQVPMLSTSEKLEDAISSLESNSWSIRMDAVEYIGRVLVQKKQSQQPNDPTRVDDRVLVAFIKHMGDAHYRVAQAVHKNFLSLLQLASPQQLQPHLKAILPKLFQKQVDTKESIRAVAKENLDYLLKTMDASVLMTSVIPLLMDGGNMKVKAAVQMRI